MTDRTLGQAVAVAYHSAGGTTEERWEAAGQAAAAAERAEYDRLTGGFDAQGRNLAAERADAGVLREQLAIATVALRDIKDCYGTGAFGHDTAHSALDEIGGVKPGRLSASSGARSTSPPELAVAIGDRNAFRDAADYERNRVINLTALVRDMLQAFPDTADEQEWRDRAGGLGVQDPDGNPYRAYTEEDL